MSRIAQLWSLTAAAAGACLGYGGLQPAAALAAESDARVYEMVSPPDKNGVDVDNTSGGSLLTFSLNRAAASGNAVAFNSRGTFAGSGGSAYSQYLATRTPEKWVTKGLNPPLKPVAGLFVNPAVQWLSDDLSHGVMSTLADLSLGETAPYNLYRVDLLPQTYRLITKATTSVPPQNPAFVNYGTQSIFTGASEGLDHIVFEDNRRLTPDAPPDQSQVNLYDWTDAGLRLASVLPDGTAATGDVQAGGHGVAAARNGYPGDFAVSADGSRVFFTVGQRLFVRVNGQATIPVSASEVDGSSDDEGTFQLANPSGTIAVFTSAARLTDDATASGAKHELYRWDSRAPVGSRLTNLTTTDPTGAGVLGVAGASRDASVIYFAASGLLTPDAVPGELGLYRWESGVGIRYVTGLAGMAPPGFSADESIWTFSRSPDVSSFNDFKGARVSADGDKILFSSSAKVTDYENAGHRQLYIYDAEDDEINCISCNRANPMSAADASLLTNIATPDNLPMAAPFLPRNLSADGERVWFDSAESLVPEDTNGAVDVYEWSDGEVRLISSGVHSLPSKFVDASTSGDDVFFTTYQRLVGWDQDELADLYDARVRGGLPEPDVRDSCQGDACQGAATPPAELRHPASVPQRPRGKGPVGPRPRATIRSVSAARRSSLASRGTAALLVNVNRGGSVSLVATAKVGKRVAVVARSAVRARRPGTVAVTVRLSRAARAALARRGRLRITLYARLGGQLEPDRVRVRLWSTPMQPAPRARQALRARVTGQ